MQQKHTAAYNAHVATRRRKTSRKRYVRRTLQKMSQGASQEAVCPRAGQAQAAGAPRYRVWYANARVTGRCYTTGNDNRRFRANVGTRSAQQVCARCAHQRAAGAERRRMRAKRGMRATPCATPRRPCYYNNSNYADYCQADAADAATPLLLP